MSAISGVNGDVFITVAPSVSLGGSPESCTDQGNHIHYFANVHQFWDPSQPLVVQYSPNGTSGWTNDTSGDYAFYYPVGEIVFASARTPGVNNFIRINSGYYFSATQLDGAHMWKLAMKGGIKETTPFQATGAWAQQTAIIKNATGSINAFRQDDRLLKELNNTSNAIIGCQLWFYETGGYRWQFYAEVTDVQQNVDVQNVDTQVISFIAHGPLYMITSNTLSSSTVTQE